MCTSIYFKYVQTDPQWCKTKPQHPFQHPWHSPRNHSRSWQRLRGAGQGGDGYQEWGWVSAQLPPEMFDLMSHLMCTCSGSGSPSSALPAQFKPVPDGSREITEEKVAPVKGAHVSDLADINQSPGGQEAGRSLGNARPGPALRGQRSAPSTVPSPPCKQGAFLIKLLHSMTKYWAATPHLSY